MKKILAVLLILSLVFGSVTIANANCWGAIENGLSNWTVASNCTISDWLYSVWGVIDVNSKIVTISSNAALIVDWKNDKMTFTTWKVLMSWNANIYSAISGTYVSYTQAGVTNCPSGTSAWNPITRSNATTKVNASRSGRVVCK